MTTGGNSERTLIRILGSGARTVLPRATVRWIKRLRGRPSGQIPRGWVRFGDLRQLSPIGRGFGWKRGTPIDRYYIGSFLARNAADIRGRVLEAGDNHYTTLLGGARVERSDIFSVETTNPKTTIIADIAQAGSLPDAAFDRIVLTQVLQYIYNLRAGVENLYRALKPGGILLLTAPGATPMEDVWPWYWGFTAAAIFCLLDDRFGKGATSAEVHGNIFAATAFLYGLAIEELDISDLRHSDQRYPVIVAARVVKRRDE